MAKRLDNEYEKMANFLCLEHRIILKERLRTMSSAVKTTYICLCDQIGTEFIDFL